MSPPGNSADTTGTLLVRSAAEIEESLEEMRAAGDTLSASLEEGEQLFLSRLLQVDPVGRTMTIAFSDARAANRALLARDSVIITCNHRGVHYEFMAARPHEVQLADVAAIRFSLPAAMLAMRRRAHPRFAVPPRVPLKCVVEWGPVSFEAQVVDVSRKGVGTIVYDAGIRLEPGTRLPRARIEHPRRTVLVGLEVRHARRVTLPDGRPAMRAGCRLIGAHHDLEDLIRLFVTDLEAGAGGG